MKTYLEQSQVVPKHEEREYIKRLPQKSFKLQNKKQ